MAGENNLTVAEVAERCNVRPESVLRWIHTNKIQATTLNGVQYRIAESELAKVLKPAEEESNDGK